MTKVCRKCGIEKPLSDFVKRKSSPDGRRTFCKACLNMELREQRQPKVNHPPNLSAVVANGKKGCSQCEEMLPVSRFAVSSSRKCGLQSRCRDCEKDYRTALAMRHQASPIAIQKRRRFPPFKGYGLPECRGW
ncbi:hypothetical protein CO583_01790 [Parasaccharibacter sp. TMW2.1882]|nr:hypothetical protein [Parasaccharibacter sp. TMW2.1882]